MVRRGIVRHAARLSRISGSLLAIDEGCGIPGLLVRQRAALPHRHIGLDKGCSGIDPRHARAPVVTVRPPERGEHQLAVQITLPLPVTAMAGRTILLVNLCAALRIIAKRGFFEFRIALAGRLSPTGAPLASQ